MSTSSADTAIVEFLGGKEVSYTNAQGLTVTETPPVQSVFHQSQLEAFLKERRVADIPLDMLRRKLTEAGYEEKRRVVGNCNGGKQIDVWQRIVTGQKRAPTLTDGEVTAISAAYNGGF